MKTKKMNLILLAITVFIFATAPVIGQNKSVADTTKQDTVIYTCSMHPEIQSSQPGTCPKCGMALIKKSTVTGKKEKRHKMSSMGMGMGIGMGIMMAVMLIFLIRR